MLRSTSGPTNNCRTYFGVSSAFGVRHIGVCQETSIVLTSRVNWLCLLSISSAVICSTENTYVNCVLQQNQGWGPQRSMCTKKITFPYKSCTYSPKCHPKTLWQRFRGQLSPTMSGREFHQPKMPSYVPFPFQTPQTTSHTPTYNRLNISAPILGYHGSTRTTIEGHRQAHDYVTTREA